MLENYLLAKPVVDRNGLDNVVLFHAGLGTALGTARIDVGGDVHLGGASHFVRDSDQVTASSQTTSVMTLDQLGIGDLVLPQLDVEGFEAEVLRGAEETIRTLQPVIVVADNRNECAQILAAFGYSGFGRVSNNNLYLTPDHAARLGYQ